MIINQKSRKHPKNIIRLYFYQIVGIQIQLKKSVTSVIYKLLIIIWTQPRGELRMKQIAEKGLKMRKNNRKKVKQRTDILNDSKISEVLKKRNFIHLNVFVVTFHSNIKYFNFLFLIIIIIHKMKNFK